MEGKVDLRPWFDPVVPGPVQGVVQEDGDGWGMIDTLGVWDCGLSSFRALENVPLLHREKWARIMFIILRRLQEATSVQEETRALKWFLIAPQAFLREPRRGGKKSQSNSVITARFDSVMRDDWGTVLALLQADRAALRQREGGRRGAGASRRGEDEATTAAKLRKTVLALLKRGQISRAVRRICSHGLASADDPQVQAALQAKYTARGRDLPTHVYKGQCMERMEGLREDLVELDLGVAPGFGGLRNEHLRCLGEVWEDDKLGYLETFSLKYVNGELLPWFYKVWGSVSTFPLFKNSARDALRPVGVKSSLVRSIHKKVVVKNRALLTEFLEPEQLALSKAGGAKLVHQVRMMAEQNPDMVIVKVDMKNAHNEVSRASVLEGLENEVSLRHLSWHQATCQASHTGLESGGRLWGWAGEGQSQGDPEASAWFCVAWHMEVRELNATLTANGGMARFGNDDGYLVGPADIVFPALDTFATKVREKCLLHLQVTKTEVFTWSGILPPEAPQNMSRGGAQVGDTWFPGFLCYGIPVGTKEYCKHMLMKKVHEVREEVDKVKKVLGENDSQAMWIILKCSLAQKFDWHLSLCYPTDIREAAMEMDSVLWDMLQHCTRLHIPRAEEGLGVECVLGLPGVASLQGRSFQRWLVHQPVKLGGLGLRSQVETSAAAFIGGVEMSLPTFTGEDGICQQLEVVVGRVAGPNRWESFLAHNSKTAVEFNQAWGILRFEAQQCSNYLGKDLVGELAAVVARAGGENTDGSTRRAIVQQREGLRHEVLSLALQRHGDRGARPVTVYQNYDKISGAWLLALPGPDTGLSSSVFSEAMAAHLCLPSPAVTAAGWVGIPTTRGGAVIDKFGDAVMCCKHLPGDTWRARHDTGKLAIVKECLDAKLIHDCEVYGLFADLIPAGAADQGEVLHWGRARQGLVPDFRLRLPTPEGLTDHLAELKFVSAGVSWFPRGVVGKGTDRRANGLTNLYKQKLAALDARFHATQQGQTGPLVRRLLSYGKLEGFVVGPWGECSKDIHSLVKVIGETKAASRARARGRQTSDRELGALIAQTRKFLSVAFTRAQGLCLLNRLGFLGEGARAAAGRRDMAHRNEAQRQRDLQAHYQAHVRGRGLSRVGQVFVP